MRRINDVVPELDNSKCLWRAGREVEGKLICCCSIFDTNNKYIITLFAVHINLELVAGPSRFSLLMT